VERQIISTPNLDLQASGTHSKEIQTEEPSVVEVEKLLLEAREREVKLMEELTVGKEQILQQQFRLVNVQHSDSLVLNFHLEELL